MPRFLITEYRPDGTWVVRGSAWIGPGQDRAYALMNEFGVPEYKQDCDGAVTFAQTGLKLSDLSVFGGQPGS
jgi:monoamine oxidase